MTKLVTIQTNNGATFKVMPRWRGRNLAVHAPVIDGKCQRQTDRWVITHLATGYKTGGDFYGTLREAVLAARLWDDMFATATAENASRWPLKEQWKRIIRQGVAERPFRSLKSVQEILAG